LRIERRLALLARLARGRLNVGETAGAERGAGSMEWVDGRS